MFILCVFHSLPASLMFLTDCVMLSESVMLMQCGVDLGHLMHFAPSGSGHAGVMAERDGRGGRECKRVVGPKADWVIQKKIL